MRVPKFIDGERCVAAAETMKMLDQDLIALLQSLGAPQLNPELRQLLLREWFCWKWTTRHGKYAGCRLWSAQALQQCQDAGCRLWSAQALQQCQDAGDSGLRHEHVVPRAEVSRRLEKLLVQGAGAGELQAWLDRMCLGCVLTREEDDQLGGRLASRMPDGWDGKDPWARYQQAFKETGLTVWEVTPERTRVRIIMEITR